MQDVTTLNSRSVALKLGRQSHRPTEVLFHDGEVINTARDNYPTIFIATFARASQIFAFR